MSQLAPKYPWRQRHSFGLTHTSFSLQVKLPSQRARVDTNGEHEITGTIGSRTSKWYIRVRHSFPSCAHPLQHTSPDDLQQQLRGWEWEGNARTHPKQTTASTDVSVNICRMICYTYAQHVFVHWAKCNAMSSPFSTVCQAFGSRAEKHEHKEAFSRQSSIPHTSANTMDFCKMSAFHIQLEGAECFQTITRAKVLV